MQRDLKSGLAVSPLVREKRGNERKNRWEREKKHEGAKEEAQDHSSLAK